MPGPFKTFSHPMIIKSKDRKPSELGPKVRVDMVRDSSGTKNSNIQSIINGDGLMDYDRDGFLEHRNDPTTMCLEDWTTNSFVEFELPEPTSLSGVEVWNYNEEWQTGKGVRSLDVSVSLDGTTWTRVVEAGKLPQAFGEADYDEPAILKLNGAVAKKIRFEHIALWADNEMKFGLSEVVFHESTGLRAGPMKPQDGEAGVDLKRPLEWVPGTDFTEHRVYLGTNANELPLLQATRQNRSTTQELKADTTYFWRVDEVKADGKIIKGRIACFETVGRKPIAWWSLLEKEGTVAADATLHRFDGKVKGPLHWLGGTDKLGGLEFDGAANFIDCGNPAELNFRQGITVSAWVKIRKFDKSSAVVVSKGNSWKLQRNGDGDRISFIISGLLPTGASRMNNVTVEATTNRKVDDNQWHHVVGLYNGQRIALYLDGKLCESSDVSGSISLNDNSVMIGENAAQKSRFFNGGIRDVRLYSHGLDVEGVKELYKEGLGTDSNTPGK
jgi:hypothetical protein